MSSHALVGTHRGSNPNTAHPVGKHACVQAAAPAQQAAHARQKHTHGAGQRWSPKWWGNNEKVPNLKRPYSTVQIKLMVCVEKVSTCWKGKKTGFRRRPPRKNEFIGISIWSCTAHINRWAIKKRTGRLQNNWKAWQLHTMRLWKATLLKRYKPHLAKQVSIHLARLHPVWITFFFVVPPPKNNLGNIGQLCQEDIGYLRQHR